MKNGPEEIKVASGRLLRVLACLDPHRGGTTKSLTDIQLRCLFYVGAKHPEEANLMDVYRALEISDSTAQRSLSMLGSHARNKTTSGLGLVEITTNPENRRERLIRLTIKGKKLLGNMARAIEGA